MASKEKIDWEKMEPDWRAGIISKKQLSKQYGVSRAAIDKHWGNLGIERDLTAKIRAEAKCKVTRATVTPGVTPLTRVTEQEVIAVNAQVQADVILGERTLIVRYRELVKVMLKELEETTGNHDEFEKLGELMDKADEQGVDKLNEIYHRVIAMPQRVDSLKKLIEVLKILIGMERQVFNIDEGATGDDPLIQVLNEVAKRRTPLVMGNEDNE